MKFFAVLCSLILLASASAARPAPDSFADLAQKLTPTVVNISTTQTVEGGGALGELFSHNWPENFPLQDIPEIFKDFYGKGNKRSATSLGSGFIISSDGYIVTNHHVVENSEEITVTFNDDSKADATIVGSDPKTDIALLKVETKKPLPYVKWGDSSKSRVGDWVMVIGNPFGFGHSVSVGIVSARARDINAGPFDDFIQTDAAINKGSSGGPLFNLKGEVIGINSAIFSPSGGNVGVGFSVSTSLATPVIDQLRQYGRTHRGWLGVKIQKVDDDLAENLGLKKAMGALVIEVTPGSPADKAGMLAGDVILEFDNNPIITMRKLPRIVAETAVNKDVEALIWRDKTRKTLSVKVAELDETDDKKAKIDNKGQKKHSSKTKEVLGLHLSELNKKLRSKYNIDKDIKGLVVVEVTSASAAEAKGIQPGSIILSADHQPIQDVDTLQKIVHSLRKADKKSVLLLMNIFGETQFIALPVKG